MDFITCQCQILIFFLVSFFTCCGSLFCFNCFSTDPGCGDHFGLTNTYAFYCTGTCMKYRGERYSNQIRYVDVTRTCKAQEPDGCYETEYNNIAVTACACNTDYCNTGIQNVNMPVNILLGILSTIVLWAQR